MLAEAEIPHIAAKRTPDSGPSQSEEGRKRYCFRWKGAAPLQSQPLCLLDESGWKKVARARVRAAAGKPIRISHFGDDERSADGTEVRGRLQPPAVCRKSSLSSKIMDSAHVEIFS